MESVIEEKDFIIIGEYIKFLCGRKISYSKEYLINMRLRPLLEKEHFSSFHEFANIIDDDKNNRLSLLKDEIISATSVNETYFFRDDHPFQTLQDILLKELYSQQNFNQKSLNIWSVACSTGQEPYSIAMSVENFKKENPIFKKNKYQILATDIDKIVLKYAYDGIYNKSDVNRGLTQETLSNYFTVISENKWQVNSIIRKSIKFHKFNLLEICQKSLKRYDLIFLRNILIYFDDDLKLIILKFIEKKLEIGGYLFLGASETLFGMNLSLRPITIGKTIVYKKIS